MCFFFLIVWDKVSLRHIGDKKVAILTKCHTDMKSDKREPYHKSCHVDISIPEVLEKTCTFIKFLPKVQSDIMMKK